jgi:hypothetical protein
VALKRAPPAPAQHHGRADEGDQHAQDGDACARPAADGLAEQAGDDGADQRRQRHRQQQVLEKGCRHGCVFFGLSP